jgi:hypothetical protein
MLLGLIEKGEIYMIKKKEIEIKNVKYNCLITVSNEPSSYILASYYRCIKELLENSKSTKY